ncbi:MAG: hypothetical protein IT210_01165 [Armatimonadetes bacterium]|nr:hypothetical protein [Armatimonadota bacterium]
MADVFCLGEALIDFVSMESGVSLIESPGFLKAAGGAPANVSVGLARLGVPVAFMGKVGEDPFGHYLERTFRSAGVDTSPMRFDREARTGLSFVSLTGSGERDFIFFRNPSADMRLSPDEVDPEAIRRAKIFQFGSITLITEPSRSATLKALDVAKEAGLIVSYDPNLRLPLWPSEEQARQEILVSLPLADIVKVSEVELEFLFGSQDAEKGTEQLLDMGAKIAVATLGEAGCFYRNKQASGAVKGFEVNTVDTTGAGDGFVAGLLTGLLRGEAHRHLDDLDASALDTTCRYANAVGALATTRKGAIPALPTADEVARFLA